MTHTHVGCRPHVGHVGHVHCGAKLWGHRIPKAGRRHALNGGPTVFTAICGEKVVLEQYDDFGFRIEEPNNVRPVDHPEARPVTCKRCLRRMGA